MTVKQQRGFTMVEVLIAVLIMAIGLLGLAGLQLTSLQSNQSAYQRSLATMAAMEIADRMLANGGQLASYATSLGAPSSASTCISTSCGPSAMASYDLAQWKCSLGKYNTDDTCTSLGVSGELPEGDGQIVDDGTGTYTITIMWDDERTGVQGTGCSGDPDVDLTCFTMSFKPRS